MRRGAGGFGRTLGQGYGWARPGQRPRALRRWSREIDANTELAALQEEAEDVQAYLKDVEHRIAELEKESK
jgi:cell fate (sporulation/competence/biofilm development) regulator YlbF (YheA/YmcA/DUF963 family)